MLIKETSDMTDVERQTVRNQNNSYLETGIQKVLGDSYNIDELKLNGKFAVLNATGTLPSGYSTEDNNFFIECYMWFEHYGRQVLRDVRTNKTFLRNLYNGVWQPYEFVDRVVEQGETTVDGVTWTWEKWNSGKAVCWCQVDYTNIKFTTAWGSLFTADTECGGIQYPLEFIEIPQEYQTIIRSDALCFIAMHDGNATTTTSATFELLRATATASDWYYKISIGIRAIGKWK